MGLEKAQIKGAPTCRVVYPKGLFKKVLVKGAEDKPENYKYNAIILIPKDDPVKMAQIQEMYAAAFAELQGKGYKGKRPKDINVKNNCLIDGDEYADSRDGADAFRGYMMLKVSSKTIRPIVTDAEGRVIFNNEPIPETPVEKISDETLEDGDYVRVAISFWTYNHTVAQGIGANVLAVKRYGAGERIGGASRNVDDYITDDYE